MILGVVLLGAATILSDVLSLAYWRYLALLALIVVGAVAYFAIGQIIGAFRLSEFRSALRRGKA